MFEKPFEAISNVRLHRQHTDRFSDFEKYPWWQFGWPRPSMFAALLLLIWSWGKLMRDGTAHLEKPKFLQRLGALVHDPLQFGPTWQMLFMNFTTSGIGIFMAIRLDEIFRLWPAREERIELTGHWHALSFMVLAVDEGFWQVRNFWPLTAKLFGLDAVNEHKRECVMGAELAKKMFGDTQVRGKDLEINREIYRISGVLGGVTDSGLANSLFLPLTTAMDRFPGRMLADRLYLRCTTWDDVGAVAAAIPGIVKAHNPPSSFTSKSPGKP